MWLSETLLFQPVLAVALKCIFQAVVRFASVSLTAHCLFLESYDGDLFLKGYEIHEVCYYIQLKHSHLCL